MECKTPHAHNLDITLRAGCCSNCGGTNIIRAISSPPENVDEQNDRYFFVFFSYWTSKHEGAGNFHIVWKTYPSISQMKAAATKLISDAKGEPMFKISTTITNVIELTFDDFKSLIKP